MSKLSVLIYKKGNLLGTSGGIEKFVSWFSGALAAENYDVFLATRDRKKASFFYPLNKKVKFHHFHVKFSRLRQILGKLGLSFIPFFNKRLYISKMIRLYCDKIRPDIIITEGIQDLADIVYKDPYPCKKVVQLHSEPSVFFTRKKKDLFEKTLKQADLVQVLLPSFICSLRPHYQGKIAVIGNPIFSNKLPKKEKNVIIYPARVEENKQQHLLIEAFAKIAPQFPNWQVHFFGDTSNCEYTRLCKQMIKKYGLEKQVKLMGVTKCMDKKLAESSICAFPSRFEGFGLGLTEAMSTGLPCVGFVTTPSVNFFIQNEKTGFLVQDTKEFAEKLALLMKNKELRTKFGSDGKDSCKLYEPKKIINQWENTFRELTRLRTK